jgi:hypothetical protein
MAGVAQMTVEAAYHELQKLSDAARAEVSALNAQKLELQARYTQARNSNNAAAMKFLQPLIHKNSQLRLQFRDLVAKFNGIVAGLSGLLRRAGVTVPQLSGLGAGPLTALVPVAWGLGIVAAWSILWRITGGRKAIANALESDGPRLLAIASDPTRSEAERKAALEAYKKLMDEAGVDFMSQLKDVLVPIAFVIAAIVLGPPLLQAFKGRRARA